MFDAEIAARLLNRWEDGTTPFSCISPFDLLHEGNLMFTRYVGSLRPDHADDPAEREIEYLVFADGSSALRVSSAADPADWTYWISTSPVLVRRGDEPGIVPNEAVQPTYERRGRLPD